jgi:hypothetical protein
MFDLTSYFAALPLALPASLSPESSSMPVISLMSGA